MSDEFDGPLLFRKVGWKDLLILLKPKEAKKFMDDVFCDDELRSSGTDVADTLLPIFIFTEGDRWSKKTVILEKLKFFLEKHFIL